MRSVGIVFIILLALLGARCQNRHQPLPNEDPEKISSQEQLIKVNQLLVNKAASIISDEGAKRGWNLKQTGTGLFYEVIMDTKVKKNDGHKITAGDEVTLEYSVSLLDGTLCYSSDKSGPKVFRVEKSEAESGLHEAVKLLNEGDSARLVLPPHLGFGIVGDGNKIPPRAILLYLIKIRSVRRMGKL
jgi:FKBP-type peptidyl-prolyl cis-trans isomerase FkpA